MGELGIRGGAIVFAALLWLTAQPLLPYAEPVLLCGTGMALGITIWMAMHAHENGAPVPSLARVTGTIAGLLVFVCMYGAAHRAHEAEAECLRLQTEMLSTKPRADMPAIFQALGCKAQF